VATDATITDGSNNAVAGNAVFDALALKANLNNAIFSGVPQAPTAPFGTNSNQIATTAFVIANRGSGGGGTGTGLPANVKVANDFAGNDMGAKINAASAACGAGACEIWVYGDALLETQAVVRSGHTVRQFAGKLTSIAGAGDEPLILLANNSSWIGETWASILEEASTPNCSVSACRYGIIGSLEGFRRDNNAPTGGYLLNKAENIVVRGVKFLGQTENGSDSGVAATVKLGNCHNCYVTNNYFYNVSAYAVEFGAASNSGEFARNCWFTDNLVERALSQNVALINGENVHIERNIFRNPGKAPAEVVNASNTSPIVITTKEPHSVYTGMPVFGRGIAGNSAANGNYTATVINPTQYRLNGTTGNGTFSDIGAPMTITDISNASPRVVTISESRNIPTGAKISIGGWKHPGGGQNGIVEGLYTVTNVSPTQFRLDGTSAGAVYQGGAIAKKTVGVVSVTNATPNVVVIDTPLDLQTGTIVTLTGLQYPATQNRANLKSNLSFQITWKSPTSFSLNGSTLTALVSGVKQVAANNSGFLTVKTPPLYYARSQAMVIIDAEPNGSSYPEAGERIRNVSIKNNLFDVRDTSVVVGAIFIQIVAQGMDSDTSIIEGNIILGVDPEKDTGAGFLKTGISTGGYPNGQHLTITGNVVKNTTTQAIEANGRFLTITNNHLYHNRSGAGGTGMLTLDGVTDSLIQGNQLVSLRQTIGFG
jgi:hypothetical protein